MNFDLFSSINDFVFNGLREFDIKTHDKIKDTKLDDFIHQLENYLVETNSIHKLSQLPKDTILEINDIYEDYEGFYDCYDPKDYTHYEVPYKYIDFSSSTGNDSCLQLKEDGLYHFVPRK